MRETSSNGQSAIFDQKYAKRPLRPSFADSLSVPICISIKSFAEMDRNFEEEEEEEEETKRSGRFSKESEI